MIRILFSGAAWTPGALWGKGRPEKGFIKTCRTPRLTRCVFLASLLLTLFPPVPPSAPAESTASYGVRIEGLENDNLKSFLETVSTSVSLKEKPPPSRSLLNRRVERDIPRLERALRSMGFYDARVDYRILQADAPYEVVFTIDPGPAYVLKDLRITGPDRAPLNLPVPQPEGLGLPPGHPALSKDILRGREVLVRWFKRLGHPFVKTAPPQVELHRQGKAVTVFFRIDPRGKVPLGETRFQGLQGVDETFLRGKLPWKEGDAYNIELLEKGKKRLIDTGLFSTVRIDEKETLDARGGLPLDVVVKERKHRSVSAGLGYRTDEGPGANLAWEHRNLAHQGERLRLSAEGSSITKAAEGTFQKAGFYREDQTLSLSLRFAEEEPDAYFSRHITSTGVLSRQLTEDLRLGAGVTLKLSEVDQREDQERYTLIAFPLNADWDTSDDPLDPTRGGRFFGQAAPYFDMTGTDKDFLKLRSGYRRYLRIRRTPPVVLAGKVSLGLIVGAQRDDIPADERFYAGGGGSVRGYAHQTVGPLSAGLPLGGRSLVEVSFEVRSQLTDHLGLAAFLDGGSAFKGMPLDSTDNFLWGAGLGFRYYTPVGPLRLDAGIPLQRRDRDDAFQVYISLGQAF